MWQNSGKPATSKTLSLDFLWFSLATRCPKVRDWTVKTTTQGNGDRETPVSSSAEPRLLFWSCPSFCPLRPPEACVHAGVRPWAGDVPAKVCDGKHIEAGICTLDSLAFIIRDLGHQERSRNPVASKMFHWTKRRWGWHSPCVGDYKICSSNEDIFKS